MSWLRVILVIGAMLMPLAYGGLGVVSHDPHATTAQHAGAATCCGEAIEPECCACCEACEADKGCSCCSDEPGRPAVPEPRGRSLSESVQEIVRLALTCRVVRGDCEEVGVGQRGSEQTWGVWSKRPAGCSMQSWLCVRTT